MAVCAKELNKPFYVLTESFKFSRLFPLSQQDLPKEYKVSKHFNLFCKLYFTHNNPVCFLTSIHQVKDMEI